MLMFLCTNTNTIIQILIPTLGNVPINVGGYGGDDLNSWGFLSSARARGKGSVGVGSAPSLNDIQSEEAVEQMITEQRELEAMWKRKHEEEQREQQPSTYHGVSPSTVRGPISLRNKAACPQHRGLVGGGPLRRVFR